MIWRRGRDRLEERWNKNCLLQYSRCERTRVSPSVHHRVQDFTFSVHFIIWKRGNYSLSSAAEWILQQIDDPPVGMREHVLFFHPFCIYISPRQTDRQLFWSIKQFSCLSVKRYKSFTLLWIRSCIMHWQAAIKLSILLSRYSDWDQSSGILQLWLLLALVFLSFSPTFYPFPSSHTSHAMFCLLPHLISSLILTLFFPQLLSWRSTFAFVKQTLCFACSTRRPACEGGAGTRMTQNCQRTHVGCHR